MKLNKRIYLSAKNRESYSQCYNKMEETHHEKSENREKTTGYVWHHNLVIHRNRCGVVAESQQHRKQF